MDLGSQLHGLLKGGELMAQVVEYQVEAWAAKNQAQLHDLDVILKQWLSDWKNVSAVLHGNVFAALSAGSDPFHASRALLEKFKADNGKS